MYLFICLLSCRPNSKAKQFAFVASGTAREWKRAPRRERANELHWLNYSPLVESKVGWKGIKIQTGGVISSSGDDSVVIERRDRQIHCEHIKFRLLDVMNKSVSTKSLFDLCHICISDWCSNISACVVHMLYFLRSHVKVQYFTSPLLIRRADRKKFIHPSPWRL